MKYHKRVCITSSCNYKMLVRWVGCNTQMVFWSSAYRKSPFHSLSAHTYLDLVMFWKRIIVIKKVLLLSWPVGGWRRVSPSKEKSSKRSLLSWLHILQIRVNVWDGGERNARQERGINFLSRLEGILIFALLIWNRAGGGLRCTEQNGPSSLFSSEFVTSLESKTF